MSQYQFPKEPVPEKITIKLDGVLNPEWFSNCQQELLDGLAHVATATNNILGSIDLTDDTSMEVARELLKRLAFLQSTTRYINDIKISTK